MTCLTSEQERPRERLLQHGPAVLTDSELLAVVMGTGVPGRNAIQFSYDLLTDFNGLRNLLSADVQSLRSVKGLGTAKICQLQAIKELALRSLSEELHEERELLDKSDLVRAFCCSKLSHLNVEHCIALFLNARGQLICCEKISQGTVSRTAVYPREIVTLALKHHATAIILSHNHPSGTLRASEGDLALTQHIKKALALIDVSLVDHIIVCGHRCLSMAEEGLV